MTNEADIFDLETSYIEDLDDLRSTEVSQKVSRWSTDWTTETLASQIRKGNIDLYPKFQRREAWTRATQSRFIESLMLGLPVPQIILAERNDNSGQYIVIDGKQRLITLSNFYGVRTGANSKPLKLIGLKSREDLNLKTYQNLSNDPDHRKTIAQFENQTIRTVIIGNWRTDDYLYDVFLRINTTGTPLSSQELRQALHPGPFADFIDRTAAESQGMRAILKLKEPDFRMRDVELLLRYYAYRMFNHEYKGNLKIFLDNTLNSLNIQMRNGVQQIDHYAKDFEESVSFTINIFNQKNFMRKWNGTTYESTLNRAVYDIMTYYFSDRNVREASTNYMHQIENAFKEACDNDQSFLESLSATTKSINANKKRFDTWAKILTDITGYPVASPFARFEYTN